MFSCIWMQHFGAILTNSTPLLALIIQNASLCQDQQLNFMQIWCGELRDEINYRQAPSMSPKTPSAFTQIPLLFWAVNTAGNFITRLCDCDRPHCDARPRRLISRCQPRGCTMVGGTSLTGSSPLDSTLPQSSSTIEQDWCARWSRLLSAEKKQLRSRPVLGV